MSKHRSSISVTHGLCVESCELGDTFHLQQILLVCVNLYYELPAAGGEHEQSHTVVHVTVTSFSKSPSGTRGLSIPFNTSSCIRDL